MNPFMLIAAGLMGCAAVWAYVHDDLRMAIVYLAFSVANAALAGAK